MKPAIIKWIGLGGASHSPLLFGLYAANIHKALSYVLIDGKNYRPSQADHEFFLKQGPKAAVQALLLHSTYPTIQTTPITKFIATNTTDHTIAVEELVNEWDYVMLFVDNHETRHLIATHAQTLENVTIISGAIDADDVHVWVHIRRQGKDLTRPPLDRFPDINAAPTDLPESMLRRSGCLEEATTTAGEERPNYFALLTAGNLTINALSQLLTLDESGRANDFPYEETWFNVRTATAVPTRKEN